MTFIMMHQHMTDGVILVVIVRKKPISFIERGLAKQEKRQKDLNCNRNRISHIFF